jgi:hypothetical protein
MPGMTVRAFAIAYLFAQAAGAAGWWLALLAWPASRAPFVAAGAPDATLLAFGPADVLLYVGLSAACAVGLLKRREWARPLLCVHTGAAMYAALYCVTLPLLTGGSGWLGAALMCPALVVPAWLCVKLRPGAHRT